MIELFSVLLALPFYFLSACILPRSVRSPSAWLPLGLSLVRPFGFISFSFRRLAHSTTITANSSSQHLSRQRGRTHERTNLRGRIRRRPRTKPRALCRLRTGNSRILDSFVFFFFCSSSKATMFLRAKSHHPRRVLHFNDSSLKTKLVKQQFAKSPASRSVIRRMISGQPALATKTAFSFNCKMWQACGDREAGIWRAWNRHMASMEQACGERGTGIWRACSESSSGISPKNEGSRHRVNIRRIPPLSFVVVHVTQLIPPALHHVCLSGRR